MEIICYALSAAVLVLTGAVISGVPRENTAETAADDTLSRDIAALMAYGREEDEDNAV